MRKYFRQAGYITSVCGYDSAEWQKQFGAGQWDEPVCDRKK